MPQRLKQKNPRPAIYPTQGFIEFLRKESKSMAEKEGCRSRVPFWRVLNHLKEEVETWRARTVETERAESCERTDKKERAAPGERTERIERAVEQESTV